MAFDIQIGLVVLQSNPPLDFNVTANIAYGDDCFSDEFFIQRLSTL
jgi:hypothetical protein